MAWSFHILLVLLATLASGQRPTVDDEAHPEPTAAPSMEQLGARKGLRGRMLADFLVSGDEADTTAGQGVALAGAVAGLLCAVSLFISLCVTRLRQLCKWRMMTRHLAERRMIVADDGVESSEAAASSRIEETDRSVSPARETASGVDSSARDAASPRRRRPGQSSQQHRALDDGVDPRHSPPLSFMHRREEGTQSDSPVPRDEEAKVEEQSPMMPEETEEAHPAGHGLSSAERRHTAAAAFTWVQLGLPEKALGGAPAAPACAVCLAGWRPLETIRVTKCGHVFHSQCLDPWLRVSGTCAVCRTQLGHSPESKLFRTATIPDASCWTRPQCWSTSPWSPMKKRSAPAQALDCKAALHGHAASSGAGTAPCPRSTPSSPSGASSSSSSPSSASASGSSSAGPYEEVERTADPHHLDMEFSPSARFAGVGSTRGSSLTEPDSAEESLAVTDVDADPRSAAGRGERGAARGGGRATAAIGGGSRARRRRDVRASEIGQQVFEDDRHRGRRRIRMSRATAVGSRARLRGPREADSRLGIATDSSAQPRSRRQRVGAASPPVARTPSVAGSRSPERRRPTTLSTSASLECFRIDTMGASVNLERRALESRSSSASPEMPRRHRAAVASTTTPRTPSVGGSLSPDRVRPTALQAPAGIEWLNIRAMGTPASLGRRTPEARSSSASPQRPRLPTPGSSVSPQRRRQSSFPPVGTSLSPERRRQSSLPALGTSASPERCRQSWGTDAPLRPSLRSVFSINSGDTARKTSLTYSSSSVASGSASVLAVEERSEFYHDLWAQQPPPRLHRTSSSSGVGVRSGSTSHSHSHVRSGRAKFGGSPRRRRACRHGMKAASAGPRRRTRAAGHWRRPASLSTRVEPTAQADREQSIASDKSSEGEASRIPSEHASTPDHQASSSRGFASEEACSQWSQPTPQSSEAPSSACLLRRCDLDLEANT